MPIVTKMEEFWHQYSDEELSPVYLAEKRHALAVAQLERDVQLFGVQVQTYARTHAMEGTNCHVDIQALTMELEEKKKAVHELWLQWLQLKPYVHKELKRHLGCPEIELPSEEEEKEKRRAVLTRRIQEAQDELNEMFST
jgi:hypothetical protein